MFFRFKINSLNKAGSIVYEIIITESIVTFLFFLVIGIVLWKSKNQIFFLFNFGYIGFAAAIGELMFGLLPREKKSLEESSAN